MTDTLRNQLLGLGFKQPQPDKQPAKPKPGRGSGSGGRRQAADRGDRRRDAAGAAGNPRPASRGKPAVARRGRSPDTPRNREDIDLARAYAIRAQREKDERIAAERAKQEEARKRREARARLAELVKDRGLNVADAEIARHFPYGGKIKRIHVTAEQLKALNAGELGVLQMDGRYLLVTAELLARAEAIFAPAVALKVDPDAPVEDDAYADPAYQVPDDLVW